jgi:hypothetical protein
MLRRDARVGLCGALGGAINAWLCYSGLPVWVTDFEWQIIPAGAFHGAVLAIAAFAGGMFFRKQARSIQLAVAVPLAWLAGFIAWIPLDHSGPHPLVEASWHSSLRWPFSASARWDSVVLEPFLYFGFVVLLYYLAIVLFSSRVQRLSSSLALATLAGIGGSLVWWIMWHHWYLAVLHGSIWGAFVGVGAWDALRSNVIPGAPPAA